MKRRVLLALVVGLLISGVPLAVTSFILSRELAALRDEMHVHIPSEGYPYTYFTPENGTHTTDHVITFAWCSIEKARIYFLQVDNNPDFSSPELQIYTIIPRYTTKNPLPDGTYYWRVAAFTKFTGKEGLLFLPGGWLWSGGIAEFTIF